MSVIAVYELLYQTGLARNLYLLVLSGLMALAVAMWSCGGGDWTPALVGLWVYFAALAAVMLASHMALKFETVCISMFAGIFIPLMLSSLTRILFLEYGRFYVLIPLILAFSSDSGAYFAGCYLGKHKLAPVISPQEDLGGRGRRRGGGHCGHAALRPDSRSGLRLRGQPGRGHSLRPGGHGGGRPGRPDLLGHQAPDRHQGLRLPAAGPRRHSGPVRQHDLCGPPCPRA